MDTLLDTHFSLFPHCMRHTKSKFQSRGTPSSTLRLRENTVESNKNAFLSLFHFATFTLTFKQNMDFNDSDSNNSQDEIINRDDFVVAASIVRIQQQLQEEIAEGNERILEKQEEVQDLDKMIQIGELSMKDVLSELDTPVNSDSEEDEVDCLLINIYICVRN